MSKTFDIRIEIFDREALKYVTKLEGLERALEKDDSYSKEAAQLCNDLKGLFMNALLKQVNPTRTEIITKI